MLLDTICRKACGQIEGEREKYEALLLASALVSPLDVLSTVREFSGLGPVVKICKRLHRRTHLTVS